MIILALWLIVIQSRLTRKSGTKDDHVSQVLRNGLLGNRETGNSHMTISGLLRTWLQFLVFDIL
jgi:hypothetical protein